MSGRILSRSRLQALAMVVIGVLLGFVAASSWDRIFGVPEAKPAGDAAPPAPVTVAPSPAP